MQVLSRRTKPSPVLVGEPGVGKTAVVEGLAQKIVKGEVPETLKDKQLYTLDLGALVAESADRGESEARLETMVKEIRARGDILLFVDELHTLIGAGDASGPIGSALRTSLVRGELQIIGASTLDEYSKYLETDTALEHRFQIIEVTEPSVTHTIELLKGLRDRYESYHRVSITDGALVAAAQLADRFISDRFLPDKAIDLIDEAGSLSRVRRMDRPPDLREYDEKIAQVRREKESAIDSQDFEKASVLRDAEKQLVMEKATREKQWQYGEMDVVAEVNEDTIAEAVSRLSGVPVQRVLSQRAEIDRRHPSKAIAIDPAKRYTLLNDQPADDQDHDLLGVGESADIIGSILTHSRTASPFVLAIDGGWGIGKSTLLRQVESRLKNQSSIVCVRFNAWTAQGGNALEGLIKSVLGQLDRNVLRRSMRRLAKRRGLVGMAWIVTAIAARFLGITRLVDEMWSRLAVDARSRNDMKELIGSMLIRLGAAQRPRPRSCRVH